MRHFPDAVPLSRTEALELGWSDSALSRAVRAGRLVRVRPGHFARGPVTPDIAARAAGAACIHGVISHRSALVLHGLPLVGARPAEPELTVPPGGCVSLTGAHVHRASLPPEHVAVVGDAEVTSVPRTLIDVARHRPTVSAVAAMDAALHAGLVTMDDLDDVLRRCWNWPRIRRAARALRLVDGCSESPLESVSRLVFRWLQVPPPRLQTPIHDQFGRLVGRSDFYWDRPGVLGEADGRGKYDVRDVLIREKQRQEELEVLGLVVVRWGWDDVVSRPRLVKSRLDQAFERGRLRDRSGFTRLWSVPAPKPASPE
jgi:Transcriptional regulator, AbiEi antitoxin